MKARRHARGAIFVESVIVCTLLVLAMIAGLFMHRLYFTKLRVVGDARVAAWTQALEGCNQGVSLDGVSQASGADMRSVTMDTEALPTFFGTVAHTRGSARGGVRAPSDLGGASYAMDTANTLACNEVPASRRGDLHSVFSYVGSTLLPHFF